MRIMNALVISVLAIMVFAACSAKRPSRLAFPVVAGAQLPVNLSGYEFLLGRSCTIDGQSAKCDVQFGGWTGGSGPVVNGWKLFPGNEEGLWKAKVNYSGTPEFGKKVAIVSGSFDVLFRNGKVVSGTVANGSVQWPSDAETNIGCGNGVATVSVTISGGGPSSFVGCLHDLPAGSVIPSRIWGTLQ